MNPDEPYSDEDEVVDALRHQVHESRSGFVKGVLVVCGTLCVVLGVLGILLPVVPTTPFLLLAATCYANSSERFYVWLLTNRFFGQYIRDWRENRGLTVATKVWVIFVLAVTMGASMYFAPLMPVRVGLGIIGVCVSVYIWRLPTKDVDGVSKLD